MKKKQLETLDKINEERKLNKETKEKIQKKVLKNFLFATLILLFLGMLKFVALREGKNIPVLISKISSVFFLIDTLILFEIAYKKDNDEIALNGIEMMFFAITTLLAPYSLINKTNAFIAIMGVGFAVYYAVKNYVVYRKEKNNYLKEKNDIDQIIKKESQDELAQEHLEKTKQENQEKPKRKRGRPRKVK